MSTPKARHFSVFAYGQRLGRITDVYGGDNGPTFARWRNNLVALSQSFPLCLVASHASIFVYHLDRPSHTVPLTEQPDLVVDVPPSRDGLPGYLDRYHPHAINRLIVEWLGDEEVVACVRDDGDVDIVLVRHIAQILEKGADLDHQAGDVAGYIKPLFQANVGRSAWGIAIHTSQRILAVSANTHHVTIFKFGLVVENANDDHQERFSDVVHQVVNGQANIPHIAFCNTGDDLEGRWLITTDIMGVCRIFDILTPCITHTFMFRVPGGDPRREDPHQRAGWTIMFLNPRSFAPEDDLSAALDNSDDGHADGILGREVPVWDIALRSRYLQKMEDLTNGMLAANEILEDCEQELVSDDPVSSTNVSSDISDDESEPGGVSVADSTPSAQTIPTAEEVLQADDISGAQLQPGDDSSHPPSTRNINDRFIHSSRQFGVSSHSYTYQQDLSNTHSLPCPILFAGVKAAYLLQPPHPPESSSIPPTTTSSAPTPFTSTTSPHPVLQPTLPFPHPTVGFTHILDHDLPLNYDWLSHFDRLNLSVSIPALGVVVLGTQQGRAVVLALTRVKARCGAQGWEVASEMRCAGEVDAVFEASPRGKRSRRSGGGGGGVGSARKEGGREGWRSVYAMRIEAIVPFMVQEEVGLRPCAPLVGIAASPVVSVGKVGWNGRRRGRDCGRWRLLLVYEDRTVLGYEIRREEGSGGVGIGMAD